MTKNMWLKVAGSLAVLSLATAAIAADHLDSPAAKADQPADINDLYSFVDAGSVSLVMTVYPAAPAEAKFSDKTQYIFHTTGGTAFGETKSTLDIVCTFDAAQTITCLAGAGAGMPVVDKATGDAKVDAGLVSENKMLTVYAGLRKDPFFFNLAGFLAVTKAVKEAVGLVPDAAGCPALPPAVSAALVDQLKKSDATPPGAPEDFFAKLNTLAIVIKVDKALIGGPIVSSWASTNAAN